MKRFLFSLSLISLAIPTLAIGQTALTIYNDNFGLVSQTRDLEFAKGVGETSFDDVAALIDPTSVRINIKQSGIMILEQNYQYDLVNTQKMMQKYLGSQISLVTKTDQMRNGALLSFDGKFIILKDKSGEITITNADEVVNYRFGSLPEGLILKPTLVWLAESDKKQSSECEVSYLTNGINWHAEYIAVVDADDKNLDLSGWVSIENNSGATYKDATLKLVAGKVHRLEDRQPIARAMSYGAKADFERPFEEESFFEYHLYSLTRPATVADREIKQLSLFETTTTPAKKVYAVDSNQYWRGADEKPKVKVNMEFVNSKERGLGMPLPQGKLRVYKADSKGILQFIGEDKIDHTPKDEKVRVMLGEAFDIVCQRVKSNVVNLGPDHWRDTYEVTLRNHKEEDIIVTVVEPALGWREWRITDTNLDYTKVSSSKIEFQVPVSANGESKMIYTIEY